MSDSQIYKSGAGFSIIIDNVNAKDIASISDEFSKAFSLEPSIAVDIIKSAPVVFLTDVNKQELKALTHKLVELSEKGMEFRITARSTDKIPQVKWHIRPQFAIGAPQETGGITIKWNNNVFTCPNCGEAFLFRQLGKLPLGDEIKLPSTATETKRMPQTVSTEPAEKVAFKDTDKVSVELSAAESQLEQELSTLQEGNIPTLETADASGGEEPVAEFETVTDDDDSLSLEPSDDEVVVEISDEPLEIVDEAGASPADGAETDNGVYNVFLSKVTDDKKKREAAKIISEIKGITFSEALALTGRSLIPLLKEVPKTEATAALAKFEKINIFGRMTKL